VTPAGPDVIGAFLDGDARDAIERVSQHLARRLLREPLERLGRVADGRPERAALDLFGL
jgi:hypothetical protein